MPQIFYCLSLQLTWQYYNQWQANTRAIQTTLYSTHRYQTLKECYSFYEYDPVVSIYRFFPRVRYGKINLYYHCNIFLNTAQGSGTVTVNYNDYFFEKEKGKLILFTFKTFYDAVKDNPEAMKTLNEVFPRAKIPHSDYIENLQKLASVVDIYNK